MRGRRGEPLAAESSSGSSVFGSLVWDSDKIEEAFPSEGDDDPVCAYSQKCSAVTSSSKFTRSLVFDASDTISSYIP